MMYLILFLVVSVLVYLLVKFSKKEVEVKVEVKPAPINPLPETIKPPEKVVIKYKIGDTGDAIKNIQQRLKDLGYPLAVDGEFGGETKLAVTLFQKINGVGQTGEVGPQTWGVLMGPNAKKYEKPDSKNSKEIMEKAADIALVEAKKKLSWTGLNCEAEKYLAPFRKALGAPSGRFAWCSCFVVYCIREAGGDVPTVIPGTNLTWAYVPAGMDYAKKNGWWFPASDKNFNPRKGDLVLFDWDGGEPDHIGMVIDYKPGEAYVECAEGNTSPENETNGNKTALKKRHWSLIKGFVRFSV